MSSSSTRPTRLHVGNLPFQATIRDVEEFLHGYGPIKHILLKKGFAFVEFLDGQDAEAAIRELNGRMLYGRNVTLEYAQIQSQWYVNPRRYSLHSPIRRSRSPQMRSRSPSPMPTLRRELSPRAAAWYQGMRPSREVVRENLRLAHEERHRQRRSSRRRSRSQSSLYSREDRHRRISPRRRSPFRFPSRSRSPHLYNSHHHRRNSRSRTPSQSSSAIKRELPTIDLEDGLDEYEEVEEEPFFKLLDHRPELEEIAGQLALDINIRPFDGSVAFGCIANMEKIAKSTKVKQEPSTSSSNCAPIEPVEKWMVFADRGPTVHVSSYERNALVREHTVPKFEWEPFSGAIRGMCEKFLMGK